MFSRVTVVGARRRVDVVLPADEAVGTMTGELIRLLDEPVSSPPLRRYLVTPGGEVLGGDATLAAAEVSDGALLRLVGEEGLPPAPVVYDVAEEAASDRDSRPWVFDARHRHVLGVVLFAALVVVAATVVQALGPSGNGVLPALAAGLVVAGAVLGRASHGPLAHAFVLSGVLVGLEFLVSGPLTASWSDWQRWSASALVLAVAPLLLAAAGRPARGAVLGSAVALAMIVLWTLGIAFGVGVVHVAAVVAVVCVAVLGFLPRAALIASGIASLDDRRAGGQDVTRRDVKAALSAAHEGLVLACVATSVSAAVAGYALAQQPTRWTVPLGCLLAFVFVSRSRVFPLVLEVVAMLGVAGVVAVAFVLAWARQDPTALAGQLAVIGGLAASSLLMVALSLSEHAQARLRILLDRVEMLAVVATIPLVVGIFGTYSRLLHMF